MWKRLPEIILQVADRLMDAQIENRPALEVIKHNDGKDILIYADPPYVKNTRTLNGDQYRFEMSDDDHVELLNALKAHTGMVMISGYDCDLYRDMLTGWRMECVASRAERGVPRTECLWMNQRCNEESPQIMM